MDKLTDLIKALVSLLRNLKRLPAIWNDIPGPFFVGVLVGEVVIAGYSVALLYIVLVILEQMLAALRH